MSSSTENRNLFFLGESLSAGIPSHACSDRRAKGPEARLLRGTRSARIHGVHSIFYSAGFSHKDNTDWRNFFLAVFFWKNNLQSFMKPCFSAASNQAWAHCCILWWRTQWERLRPSPFSQRGIVPDMMLSTIFKKMATTILLASKDILKCVIVLKAPKKASHF